MWQWSTVDRARVSQYQDLDGANQQWQLIALGATAGTFANPIKRNGPDPWLQYHNGVDAVRRRSRSAHPPTPGNGRPARSTKAWNSDGTPNVGTRVRLGVTLTAPAGE